jgi:solute carrier family 25 phosphate transporter 23/24/25/41
MSAKKEEERIEQLFKELDVDQKGYLDHISFLSQFEQTLKNKPLLLKLSKELVKECDQEGKVTAKEFREYCLCKQAETRNLFYKISKNNNFITTNDLKAAFDSSGIVYSTNDLDLFIKNITASKTGSIDIKEVLKINKWQEFFMFSPKKSNLKEALNFYTLMSNVDFNSDLSIPQKVNLPNTKINHLNDKEVVAGDIQKPAEIELKKLSNISQDGQWLKYLYAGGIAGAVSRTATAPLDRLKVIFTLLVPINTNWAIAT